MPNSSFSLVTDVLTLVWQQFQEHARWPTYARVDRAIYRETNEDLATILEPAYPDRVIYDTYGTNRQSPVTLTLAGIASVDPNAQDLRNVLAAVRLCVLEERMHDPVGPEDETIEITRDRLCVLLGIEPTAALAPDDDTARRAVDRVFAIFVSEGIPSTSTMPSPDDPSKWSFTLDTRIRRFKEVETLDDLLAVLERPRPTPAASAASLAAASFPFPASPIASPRHVPAPVSAAPTRRPDVVRVFVLMPFGPTWSSAVYRAIRDGCVDGAGERVEVERSDDITETGSITDQTLRRIETAELLVADLTGTNGNVMYEVGYADALRKAIVVINQDVASTPFDLSVHRQIEYATWDLPDLTAKIGRFTRTAVEGRARRD